MAHYDKEPAGHHRKQKNGQGHALDGITSGCMQGARACVHADFLVLENACACLRVLTPPPGAELTHECGTTRRLGQGRATLISMKWWPSNRFQGKSAFRS
jgi:hypothetical protein